jgi:hypothetical protein
LSFPKSAKDTGRYILGVRIYTDDLIPNCNRCFVLSGTHAKTKEIGWFVFCKKSGNLEKVGPYETYYKALRVLTLTKGCDSCKFNEAKDKISYLPLLDEKVKQEMSELYGGEQTLSIVMEPLQYFVESRNFLDVNFEARFGMRFFRSLPDDAVATVDLIKPCQNAKDFAFKIQALAGMIDRINENDVKKLIKSKEKQNLTGSINILQQILKENFPNYPRHIISNLRNLMSLRSKMYPTHATACEILIVLGNFGIDRYPLENWEDGWKKILSLCSKSLADLITTLQ